MKLKIYRLTDVFISETYPNGSPYLVHFLMRPYFLGVFPCRGEDIDGKLDLGNDYGKAWNMWKKLKQFHLNVVASI